MLTGDLWPIIDTGIKLALGAGMTVGAIWLYSLKRAKFTRNEFEPRQHRVALFEQISSDVGQVNHSFAKYSALVIESTRFGKRWPAARKQELERINAELVRDFDKLAASEAKLLMLGEKTMEKTLRLYGAKIALFRKQVYIGRQDISDQEIAELKQGILELRERFYDLLSRRYDRLLTA
ncbi:energy transducer TonB [Teredinibacter sp. KSP-S5-2]|uniref:energy transducer TonB n=1 Tax=Teredinibacter sp. KSP-S5-2 TaxID=3034506 RepID=UPI0029349F1A|nr:energy transducer TonB [Teredinibacter sp. KSP-S5-2]WNO09839.1 energy transducer TonB [Teredinibacter sp. KSP-S5-2]